MRASEDIGCAESAAEQIKPDCCRTPAVVSIFPDSAACVLSFYRSTTPLHLTYLHRTHRDPTISWHFISFYTDCVPRLQPQIRCSSPITQLYSSTAFPAHRLHVKHGSHVKTQSHWLPTPDQLRFILLQEPLTPSLPQPVKFPGWKTHGRACKQYTFRSSNFYFQCFAFSWLIILSLMPVQ